MVENWKRAVRRCRLLLALLALALPARAAALPADTVALAAPAKEAKDTARAPRRTLYELTPGDFYTYQRPRPFRFLLNVPRDLAAWPKQTFRRGNWGKIELVAGSSVLLYVFDQQILNSAQQFGRFIHLAPTNEQTTLVDIPLRVRGVNLDLQFNAPSTLNSSFYYLGDGWTHLSVATSFWVYGLAARDNRAAQTASELGTAILTTGLATQLLKHLTGRESPFTTTYPRGRWRLLPNQVAYAKAVAKHDAFPSGHLATALATVTVIADNYPEYHFIRPVGYSLMGLLGFAMLNNGVHWTSDYPLGLALGYGFAKLAVARGRAHTAAPGSTGQLRRPAPWYHRVELLPGGTDPLGLTARLPL